MQGKTNKTVRLATAAIIAMAAATTAAQAQELLINGNFESGPVGYGATGYTVFNNGYTSNEFARNEGGLTFKAYAPYSQFAGSVGIQGGIAATAGQAYSLTGYMFSPSTDFISPTDFGLLELSFRNASNTVIGTALSQRFESTSAADSWIPYNLTGTAPAGTTQMQVVIGYIQLSAVAPLGAVYWDDLSLKQAVVATESVWTSSGSGGWLSGANWQGGIVPNAVGATANFGSAITAPATVTIAGAGATAGTVKFNNAFAYTVDGPGALTIDVASGSAALTVTAGSHAINAPLVVNDSTVATVAAGQTLSLGGALTLNGGAHLSAAGAGTLRINATSVTGSVGAQAVANGGLLQADVDLGGGVDVVATAGEARFNATQHVRSVAIAANAKASIPDTATQRVLRTASLSLDANGTLELGDNAAVLDYTAGNSPAAAIRAAIITGRTGGGKGIVATKTATDTRTAIGYAEASAVGSPTTFLGETGIDSTTLLLRVTLKGDATLNGIVGFEDLVLLAQNYNGTGKVWSEGDFDYSGAVDFGDLVSLAQNYNGTFSLDEASSAFGSDFAGDWILAQSLVPEPTTLAASFGAATMLLRRRRGAKA